MKTDRILVRFTKDAFEERAHPKESQRGGFAMHRIPAGTQMHLSPRSIEFWRARDADLIEVIGERAPARIVADERPTVLPPTPEDGEWSDERKTELRHAIDAALTGAGTVEAVKALRPQMLPVIDADVIAMLDDPFKYPEALRAIRRLVPARRGRKPRGA